MFNTLPLLPADPILGLSQAYAKDTNPEKVDLGVGVYKNDQGQTPIMKAILEAEKILHTSQTTKAYTPPAGIPGANEVSAKLIFGSELLSAIGPRVRSIQTPGGCGALRVAAELIQRAKKDTTLWVSTPTWANHIPLLGNAGLTLKEYPYYDYQQHAINFSAMKNTLQQLPAGDIVLLHACCHNPSGADLSRAQWNELVEIFSERQLIPFIDMAYQGFGEGLEEDAYGIRLMASRLPEVVVAASYSKNFGLYRERAGSLSLVFADEKQADAGLSQLLSITRALYSMPPSHGASLIDIILHSEELTQIWNAELTSMRQRIANLRTDLVKQLNQLQQKQDFSFIANEKGMFSFLGLNLEQVLQLRNQYSIYMTDNSRISISGLAQHNLDYVSKAIVSVL
jgi:aspartate aminotransferase